MKCFEAYNAYNFVAVSDHVVLTALAILYILKTCLGSNTIIVGENFKTGWWQICSLQYYSFEELYCERPVVLGNQTMEDLQFLEL